MFVEIVYFTGFPGYVITLNRLSVKSTMFNHKMENCEPLRSYSCSSIRDLLMDGAKYKKNTKVVSRGIPSYHNNLASTVDVIWMNGK